MRRKNYEIHDQANPWLTGGFCTGAYEIDGKAVGGKDHQSLVKLQQAYDEFYKKDIGLI